MENLTEYIRDHFVRLWPTIRDNPAELRARLDRRHLPLLTRPPRAYCIAIRAADRRICLRGGARITPEDAILNHRPHTLLINIPLLRHLCTPVYIDGSGEDAAVVTPLLGRSRSFIYKHIRRGDFPVRYVKRLAGKRGKPVPIIEAKRPLDPCSKSAYPPDAVWGDLWPWHVDAMSPKFRQSVRRVPRVHADGRFPTWRWICPDCRKPVTMLYCPIPVPHVQRFCDLGLKRGAIKKPDYAPRPRSRFACKKCHKVINLSRCDIDSWNVFVTYLTAGILFGREVPKPAGWYQRKNKKSRRPNARPAIRRAEVRDLLIDTDLTRDQIANHLRLKRGTINMHIEDAFDDLGVHSRGELRERVKLIRKLEEQRRPVVVRSGIKIA